MGSHLICINQLKTHTRNQIPVFSIQHPVSSVQSTNQNHFRSNKTVNHAKDKVKEVILEKRCSLRDSYSSSDIAVNGFHPVTLGRKVAFMAQTFSSLYIYIYIYIYIVYMVYMLYIYPIVSILCYNYGLLCFSIFIYVYLHLNYV